MFTSQPLIRSSLLAEFPALVRDLGGPLDAILDEAGLSLEQVEQPTLLIPFERQIRLLQVAADRCQYESFALELAQRQDVAIFGALSLLTPNCHSVHQGVDLFGHYLHYSVQAVNLNIRQHEGMAYFTVETPYGPAARSNQFWDHSLALSLGVMRMLCGDSWAPHSVFLQRPEPQEAGPFNRYFRAPVTFGSNFSGLVFEQSVLHQPISNSIAVVQLQLQEYLRRTFRGDLLEHVRRVLYSLLPTHGCTARTVAECLGLSVRTLQRKLQEQHTSFQAQLDQVRSELAISYLQEPQFTLTDISELLGFAELSVFSRRFNHWFGITPSQWRRKRLAGRTSHPFPITPTGVHSRSMV